VRINIVDISDNVKVPITCIHILFVGRLVGMIPYVILERIAKESYNNMEKRVRKLKLVD
jgi:hypothetical protein